MKLKATFIYAFGIFSANLLSGQISPKIKLIGGARSIIQNQDISVFDSVPDNKTAKAKAGGYSLIDLGFNIMPNKNTEILGMIRIKNQYGGFYGGGVTFDVRQMWVKGVLADVLRYQLGDINLKQTPFTFYNHNEDNLVFQNPINQIQQDIVNYESFYKSNTWRQQGLSLDFGLNFAKHIEEVNFNGYLTRLNMTNFGDVPERLFGGGTFDLIANKKLSAQYNLSSVFDVTGTSLDSNSYRNIVNTFGLKYVHNLKNMDLTFKIETGSSHSYFTRDTLSPDLNDYFLNPTIQFDIPKSNISLTVAYLNVGPDFRSPGAQSKRVDYQSSLSQFGLYKNEQIDRPIHLVDVFSDDRIYKTSINTKLMAYHPLINNVLPYGLATFNRNGVYGILNWKNKGKNINVNWIHYMLSEIRGQGTKSLKKFTMSQLQLGLDVNKLIKTNNKIKLSTSIVYQQTNRTSDIDFEKVDLNSIQIASGLEWEILPNFDLMLGYTLLQGNGNDQISVRNNYSQVVDFQDYTSNESQTIIAGGLKYNFSNKTYLGLMYQQYDYKNENHKFNNYQMNQFSIIYNLLF